MCPPPRRGQSTATEGAGATESVGGDDDLEDDLDDYLEDDYLEDDDLDDFEDDLPRQVDRRPRKTGRKQGPQNQWEVVVEDVERGVFEESLAASVKVELGGAEKWSPGAWKPQFGFSKLGLARRVHRCPFRGKANSGCCALMRETVNLDGLYTLERKAGVTHADHKINNKKKGLPKYLKLACASPVKAGMSTSKLVERMRDQHGALTAREHKQVVEERKRLKQKASDAIVPRSVAGGFGGLSHVVEGLTRAVLEREGPISPHKGA